MDCIACIDKACFECSCLAVPGNYCNKCLVEHIKQNVGIQHNIQETGGKLLPNPLCYECKFRFCEVICLCKRIGLCKVCLVAHVSSPGAHYLDYIRIEKQSKDTFDMDKKNTTDVVKNEVVENIKMIEDFIERLRSGRDSIVHALDKIVAELLASAEGCKKKLENALENIKNSRVPKEDQWPYNYRRRQGSMTPSRRNMSGSFRLCETELNLEQAMKAILNLGKVSLLGDVQTTNEQILYYFKPKTKELACIEVDSFHCVKKFLPKNLVLAESPSWCEGPNKSILFCGGFKNSVFSSEVLMIDPISLQFRPLPNMKSTRAMSAVTFYNNELFVFGGYNGSNLDTSEKFSFASGKWEDLPNMPVARSAFNVAVVSGILYMTGDSERLDAFDPTLNKFIQTEAVLPQSNYSTLAAFKECLILIQNNVVLGIDLKNFGVKKIATASPGKWWSCFPPYVNGNVLIFSRADDGHLWTFDTVSGTLNKKLKIIG